jgi:hypothetical protein
MNPKLQFVQFLFKRIDDKLASIGDDVEDYRHVEDIEEYFEQLKTLVLEVIQ